MNENILIQRELEEHSPNLVKVKAFAADKIENLSSIDAAYFDTMQQKVMSQITIEQASIKPDREDTNVYFDTMQNKVIDKISTDKGAKTIRLAIYRVAAVAAVFVMSILVVNHYLMNPKVEISNDEIVSSFVQDLKEEELDVILNEYTSNKDQFSMIINSGLLDDQYTSNEELDFIPVEYINEEL